MNIKIENPYGEDGELMTLYRNNELYSEITIDCSNDCPDTLQDYLTEFGIKASELGIMSVADLNTEPKFENDTNVIWIVQ